MGERFLGDRTALAVTKEATVKIRQACWGFGVAKLYVLSELGRLYEYVPKLGFENPACWREIPTPAMVESFTISGANQITIVCDGYVFLRESDGLKYSPSYSWRKLIPLPDMEIN